MLGINNKQTVFRNEKILMINFNDRNRLVGLKGQFENSKFSFSFEVKYFSQITFTFYNFTLTLRKIFQGTIKILTPYRCIHVTSLIYF